MQPWIALLLQESLLPRCGQKELSGCAETKLDQISETEFSLFQNEF